MNPDTTVIVPSYNGERYLAQLLDAVAEQRLGEDADAEPAVLAGEVEVLVVDSGSTDGTLEIVRARPWVRLHEIPKEQFGHGRTRNLAARLAAGRYLAFLSHDAVPIGRRWLHELTAPLRWEGSGIVGVTGKQVPRADAFPLQKREIRELFASLGPDEAVTVNEPDERVPPGETPAERDRRGFYSDVNSATIRSFLVDELPYRDLPYSEDFAFARDVLASGRRTAYAPRAAVRHSNDMADAEEYRRRMVDEVLGLRRLGREVRPHSVLGRAARVLRGSLREVPAILRDPEYAPGQKLRWLLANPAYQAARWRGYDFAARVDLDDADAIRANSLEGSG